MRGIEQFLQVDAATLGALKYAGTWNASTNTPTLASGVGVQGQYYVVSVAGSTNLDGETSWGVGDWAVFNGSVWQKVDGGSTGLLTTLTVTGNTFLATTSGNVGIGTTSPAYKLDVVGSTSTARFGKLIVADDTPFYTGANINSGANSLGVGSTGATHVGFFTNNLERMRIDSAGNFLVGTLISPSGSGVRTVTASTSSVYSQWTRTVGVIGGGAIGTSGQNIEFFTHTGTVGSETYTERMRLDSAGNLGLGVTPQAWNANHRVIELAGASSAHVVAYVNGVSVGSNYYINSGGLPIYSYTGQNATRYFQTVSGQHQWFNAASGTAGNAITFTQAMTLDASGNLGIGTTSVNSRLQVTNNADSIYQIRTTNSSTGTAARSAILFVNDTGDAGFVGAHGSGTAAGIGFANATVLQSNLSAGVAVVSSNASGGIVFHTGGTGSANERMRIDASGNVGIGTQTPSAPLDVRGASGTVLGQFLETSSGNSRRLRLSFTSNVATIESIASIGATNLAFVVDSAERFRITSGGNFIQSQPAESAQNASVTLSVANLQAGIITSNAAVTLTLPTGTNLDTYTTSMATNTAFECTFIATTANAITIAANGNTTVGNLTVSGNTSGTFRFRKTAANTFTVYRVA